MSVTTEDSPNALSSGSISTRHLVFFVVAAAAPLTVSAGFLPLGFLVGGTMLPVAFLITGVAYAIFSVGFTAMSKHVRDAGAFSAYIEQAFGRTAGGAAAMVAWAGYTLGQIGFTAAAGFFASAFAETFFSVHIAWGACATAISLIVVAVTYARIDVGARVTALLLVLEIAVLTVFAAAVWLRGGPEGAPFSSAFDPSSWEMSALGATFLITFVVFIGFEQTAVYSEEVSDSRHAVRRATYIAVALLTFVYAFAAFTILTAVGPSQLYAVLGADPSQAVFNLNTDFVSQGMTDVMQALVVTSFVAGVIALQNAGSRYLFSMGRRRMLPETLAKTSTGGSPRSAILTQGAIVTGAVVGFGLSSLDPYTQVVVWTNSPTLFAVLILQIVTSAAVVRWFAVRGGDEGIWERLVAPVVAAAILAVVLYMCVDNMALLTGLGTVGNLLVILPLVVAVVAGATLAHLRSEPTGGDPDPVNIPQAVSTSE